MASTLRVSRQIVEVLATGNGKLRVSRQAVEVLTTATAPTGQEHDVAASDALVLNQAAGVVVGDLNPCVTDVLTLISTAGVVFENLHPNVADTLALAQAAVSVVQRSSVFSASSRLWLADAVTVVAPYSLDVQDALDTDQQQYNADTGAMLDVIVGLQDMATVALAPATSRPALDRLSFAEQVLGIVLHANAKPGIALDAVALVDAAWLNGTPGASSALALGDVADATVGKVFQDAIALTDLAAVNHIGGAAVSSVLAIDQSVAFIIVRPDTRWQYTPFIGTGAAANPPPPPAALDGPVPGIGTCRFVYPVVSPTVSVLVRSPEFGNKDRLQFNRVSRETRGGTLVVFADPMWPKVETLVLTFSGLSQTQAAALLDFMAAYLGLEVGFVDWEERYWKGIIVNPTDPVVQDGRGAMYTASLEFEGELTTWTP
jgi:hypothetical protein